MKKKKIMIWIAGFLAISLLGGIRQEEKRSNAQMMQPAIAEKILRFHVRANSDTEIDQNLKLKVRDAIGTLLGEELKKKTQLQQSKEFVQEMLPQIESTAEAVLREEGYAYETDAHLTTTYFPEKTYGEYTFPAGEYQALEVLIGEGKGKNWWCVLYPNMCFRGSVYEIVEEEAKEELQEVLTTEEYEAVFQKGNYEVRFFLADWFENLMTERI